MLSDLLNRPDQFARVARSKGFMNLNAHRYLMRLMCVWQFEMPWSFLVH
jgi:hypothetical protein